jgi:uncharacterized protein YqfB (UPF0267 family)
MIVKKMKYEVGQKLMVVDNTSHHNFTQGEIVTVERVRADGYNCTNGVDNWYLYENDLSNSINERE